MMPIKALALACAVLYAAGALDMAIAQRYQGIMVEEGRPAPKQSTKKKPAEQPAAKTPEVKPPDAEKQTVEKPPPKTRPRGSRTYIPPPLQSPYDRPRVVQPTVPVYTPPKIETFGDRVTPVQSFLPAERRDWKQSDRPRQLRPPMRQLTR